MRLIHSHPHLRVTFLGGHGSVGSHWRELAPFLEAGPDLHVAQPDPDAIAAAADLVVLSLPNGRASTLAPALLDRGLRVVDLSADYRFARLEEWRQVYGGHGAVERADAGPLRGSSLRLARIQPPGHHHGPPGGLPRLLPHHQPPGAAPPVERGSDPAGGASLSMPRPARPEAAARRDSTFCWQRPGKPLLPMGLRAIATPGKSRFRPQLWREAVPFASSSPPTCCPWCGVCWPRSTAN